jgi:hypothetical protein
VLYDGALLEWGCAMPVRDEQNVRVLLAKGAVKADPLTAAACWPALIALRQSAR